MKGISKKGLALIVGIVVVLGILPFIFQSDSNSGSEVADENSTVSGENSLEDKISETSEGNVSESKSDSSSSKADDEKVNSSGAVSANQGTQGNKGTQGASGSKVSNSSGVAGTMGKSGSTGGVALPVTAGISGANSGIDSAVKSGVKGADTSLAKNQILEVKQEPCLKAKFKSETKKIKGKLQELSLDDLNFNKNKFCVFVDGKPVDYEQVKKGTLRLDWTLAEDQANVTALFCNKGQKCNLVCPKVEKDFWDTIGDEGSKATLSAGFADKVTSEEKALQKELKELKDVLNRKPSKALVAQWKVDSSVGVQCVNK